MDGIPDTTRTHGEWTFTIADGRATLNGPSAYELGEDVLPGVAFSSRHLAFARSTPETDLHLLDLATGAERRLTAGPSYEDRPAFSPDGTRIAFFSGQTGLPCLYVTTLDGEPIQLTNVGLEHERRLGGPPPGFVPPPDTDDVRWIGDEITWTSEGRVVSVRVP